MKIKSEIFNLGVFSKNLNLTQNIKVSMALRKDEVNGEKNHLNSLLSQEASQLLQKKILDEMSQSKEEFLDVMNLSESDSISLLHNYLCRNEFEFIIMSSQIGMFAQDSVLFTTSSIGNQNKLNIINSNTFYHLGKLGNIDCYIHAYKKCDDKEVICGKKNCFNYNYRFDDIKEVNQTSMAPRMLIELYYDFILDTKKLVNLHFVNEYNPKYRQFNRDKKIDELL